MKTVSQMLRIALFCDESAGARALDLVVRSRHELVAILTSPPGTAGAGAGVWNSALRSGFAPIPLSAMTEPRFEDKLDALAIDLILNVHSMRIVPDRILRVPRLGAFNLHPGPLPRYAGLNSASWAIYRGEGEHGVTVHRMESGIDAGPIAYQDGFLIEADETGLSLFLKCIDRGLPLLENLLAAAADGTIPATPQDLTQRQYFGPEVPCNGRLVWDQSADRIGRFVRACDFAPFKSPWGSALGRVGSAEISILRVALTGAPTEAAPGTIRHSASGEVLVAARDEWVEIRRVAVRGARVRPPDALPSGQRVE